MTPQKIPPFHANFDGTHCAQCVLRGVLEYFEAEKSWTWEELDKFTAKEPDKWTWPYRGTLNMLARGYDIVQIGSTDVSDYIDNGVYETLVRELGQAAADKCREMADLTDVLVDMKAYSAARGKGLFKEELRLPTLNDMRVLLERGFLIGCSLNWAALYDEKGYEGHFVLVYGIDDRFVYLHDSGRPPRPEQKVTLEKFVAACTHPTPEQWDMTAYKL